MTEAAEKTSQMPGLYKLTSAERMAKVADFSEMDKMYIDELTKLADNDYFRDYTSKASENVLSVKQLPYSVMPNIIINGKEYVVPAAIEEASVVAATAKAAKFARETGGVEAEYVEDLMKGQIAMTGFEDIWDIYDALTIIDANKKEMLDLANKEDPVLVKYGGGAKDIEYKYFPNSKEGPFAVAKLIVDSGDAMGANTINTMCETLGDYVEDLTDCKARMKILSNNADKRVVKATVKMRLDDLLTQDLIDAGFSKEDIAEGIRFADAFAWADVDRTATHNKGVMNGIDAVAIATGQDFRALESGAYTYAAIKAHEVDYSNGIIAPLTEWEADDEFVYGTIEIPMAVGTVGGSTKEPVPAASQQILRLEGGAEELGKIIATVGLLQNFAAIYALTTKGIQAGHMKLHRDKILDELGAEGEARDYVIEQMRKEGKYTYSLAEQFLTEFNDNQSS